MISLYQLKHLVFKSALLVLDAPGIRNLGNLLISRKGIILTGHHVLPDANNDYRENFCPNRMLELCPEFLEQAILTVRKEGYDIIALDDVPEAIKSANKKFVVFTFDDGYRDNILHALPVFEKHNAPFAVYIPTDFIDGHGVIWWKIIEELIARNKEISVDMGGDIQSLPCISVSDKYVAWDKVYWFLRDQKPDFQQRWCAEHAEKHQLDIKQLCADWIMSWDELKTFADNPLVTIGAHSLSHPALARLSEEQALLEIEQSGRVLEERLGKKPATFSYPIGDAGAAGEREFRLAEQAGYDMAVTTRKNLIRGGESLYAIPRVSLNGYYQSVKFLRLFLGGLPFWLWSLLRKD